MICMPQTLATPRLVLREPGPDDAEAVFAFANDPQVARYMTWARHIDLDDSHDFLEDVAAGWASGEEFCWLVEHDELGAIGTAACVFSEHGVEIGYVLARRAWGEGLGLETARAVFDAAQEVDDVYRIWATCDPDNGASLRILKALGMRYEGRLARWSARPNHEDDDGRPGDVFMYAFTR
jgi:ribosomal-protein-alanine N-acetyltransferase